MTSFTVPFDNLEVRGPNVEIYVYPTQTAREQMAKSGIPFQPIKVLAQVDTGASGTTLRADLAAKLGIPPIDTLMIHTPSTTEPIPCPVYPFDIQFAFSKVVVDNVSVIAAPLSGQDIQMLIGRDVLKHGVLIYIGYANQFTLSF